MRPGIYLEKMQDRQHGNKDSSRGQYCSAICRTWISIARDIGTTNFGVKPASLAVDVVYILIILGSEPTDANQF